MLHDVFYDVIRVAQAGKHVVEQPFVGRTAGNRLNLPLFFVGVGCRVDDTEQGIALLCHKLGHHGRFHHGFVFVPDIALHAPAFAARLDEGAQVEPVLGREGFLHDARRNVEVAAHVVFQGLGASSGEACVVVVGAFGRGISVERHALHLEGFVEKRVFNGLFQPLQFFGVATVVGVYNGLVDREVEEGASFDGAHFCVLLLGHDVGQEGNGAQAVVERNARSGRCRLLLGARTQHVGDAEFQVHARVEGCAGLYAVEMVAEEVVSHLRAQPQPFAQFVGEAEACPSRQFKVAFGGEWVGVGEVDVGGIAEGVGCAYSGEEFEVETPAALLGFGESVGEVEGEVAEEGDAVPAPRVGTFAEGHVAAFVAVVAQGHAPAPERVKLLSDAGKRAARPRVGGVLGDGQMLVARLVHAGIELKVEAVAAFPLAAVGARALAACREQREDKADDAHEMQVAIHFLFF